jgi:hypothetical protein
MPESNLIQPVKSTMLCEIRENIKMNPSQNPVAFGAPGIEPRWTSSAKEGLGTAYHTSCRLWFTLSHGIGNSGWCSEIGGNQLLHAERGDVHLVMGCSNGFSRRSVGYVDSSDG